MTKKADAQAVGRRQRYVPNGLGCHVDKCNAFSIMLDYLRVDNPVDSQVSLCRINFIEIHNTSFLIAVLH